MPPEAGLIKVDHARVTRDAGRARAFVKSPPGEPCAGPHAIDHTKKGGIKAMTYQAPEIIEIGRAEELILGPDEINLVKDSETGYRFASVEYD